MRRFSVIAFLTHAPWLSCITLAQAAAGEKRGEAGRGLSLFIAGNSRHRYRPRLRRFAAKAKPHRHRQTLLSYPADF